MPGSLSRFTPSSRLVFLLIGLMLLAVLRALLALPEVLLLVPVSGVILVAVFDGVRFYFEPRSVVILDEEKSCSFKRGTRSKLAFNYRLSSKGVGQVVSFFLRLPEGFVEREVGFKHSSSETKEDIFRATVESLPLKRGVGSIEAVYVELHSSLGLWLGGMKAKVDWKISVYPDLVHDDRNIAAFLLRRDVAGITARRRFGLGREFDRLRDYQPGDAYSEIFWKASAKCLRPITMVRRVERTQQVYALLDASRLSGRVADYKEFKDGEPGKVWPVLALDRFVNGTLSLGLAAENQGDLFGMIGFSRYPSLTVKARSGTGHYLAIRNALLDIQADESHPNYQELFAHVRSQIRSRSLIVVFTHFDDASMLERFIDSVRLIARQHLVVAITIRPSNIHPLFSSGRTVQTVDDVYEAFTSHLSWEVLESARKRLSQYGIRLLVTSQASLCSQVISSYVNIKERQLV